MRLPCPTWIRSFSLHLVFYFVVFGCHPLEACSFPTRDGKGVDLEGRGWGGVEGRETVIRIYYIRKESILSKKEIK